FHVREVEALDHDHSRLEQRVVNRKVLDRMLLDGQVVYADQLYPDLGQVTCGFGAEVDEILQDLRLPELAGVARLDQQPQVVPQVEVLELGALDGRTGSDRHHPRLADQDLQGQLVDRGAVGQ